MIYIIKRSFMDNALTTDMLPRGFRYFSFLTDGGINPECNFANENLTLELIAVGNAAGPVYPINQEVLNLTAGVLCDMLRITNLQMGMSPLTLENGYGNIIVVCSDEPLGGNFITKSNAHIEEALTIPAATTKTYWLGRDRVDAADILLLPYVPPRYNYAMVLLQYGGGTIASLQWAPFAKTLNVFGSTVNAGDITSVKTSDRVRITIQNTHVADPANAVVYAVFCEGGA
ncbi:MAG TPA: hypothetical protein VF399_12045 [bacterium]|jgi:hypothetical protein